MHLVFYTGHNLLNLHSFSTLFTVLILAGAALGIVSTGVLLGTLKGLYSRLDAAEKALRELRGEEGVRPAM